LDYRKLQEFQDHGKYKKGIKYIQEQLIIIITWLNNHTCRAH